MLADADTICLVEVGQLASKILFVAEDFVFFPVFVATPVTMVEIVRRRQNLWRT